MTFACCPGRKESEVEDLYDVEFYKQFVSDTYGVSLDSPRFKGKDKWSIRMGKTFAGQGKPWNDKLKNEVKMRIAQLVAANPDVALNPHTRESFDALVAALSSRLQAATKLPAKRGASVVHAIPVDVIPDTT
jgi:hypothetical protein